MRIAVRKVESFLCGSQWVHYFPSDELKDDSYLHSFSMFFKGKIREDRKIRIRVYSADKERRPFKNLLKDTPSPLFTLILGAIANKKRRLSIESRLF